MFTPRLFVGLSFTVLSLSAIAASTSHDTTDKFPCPPPAQARHEPPPSAFDDCKGKSEGAAIQHALPNGEKVAAICVNSPKGLFARPEHSPRPQDEPSK